MKIERIPQDSGAAAKNAELIAKLFPSVVTETVEDGRTVQKIDFDALKLELSSVTIDKDAERYSFTWPGKTKAVVAANDPANSALRPHVQASSGKTGTAGEFDSKNVYIEGDNLNALKLLQETYLGRVKMIYIDPPYNTGHDFIYDDNFAQSEKAYLEATGAYSKSGKRLVVNQESSGRFHTNWLNMIYPRLRIARKLLTDDGVIFISIDDHEVHNLRKVCDEVFGEQNFIAQLIWERAYAPKNDAKYISNSHDYVLMYARSLQNFVIGRLPRTEEANARYKNPDNDPRGVWKPSDISVKTYTPSCDYPITTPSGRVVEPPTGRCWAFTKEAFQEKVKDHRIWFGPNGDNVPSMKRFLSELRSTGMAPSSLLFYKEVGHSQEGAQELSKLLGGGYFNGPKPVRLLRRLLTLANTSPDSLVLDFFSGSATTAHAVMELNAEDGGQRKFIMVQIPEECAQDSEAYQAGFSNICEIGEERIRRAGRKIIEEHPDAAEKLDIGFRVFKIDSPNLKETNISPKDTTQQKLQNLEENIKEDRTSLDLLIQTMLSLGIPLDAEIEREQSNATEGKLVYTVRKDGAEDPEPDLIACFDSDVSKTTAVYIARKHPAYAVFRDSSFKDDSARVNADCIFTDYSPQTKLEVL